MLRTFSNVGPIDNRSTIRLTSIPGFSPVTAGCAGMLSVEPLHILRKVRCSFKGRTRTLNCSMRRVKSSSDSWQAFDMGAELDITRFQAQLSRVEMPSSFLQMLNHKYLAGRGGPPNMWGQPIRALRSSSTTTKSCSRKQWSRSRARLPLLHEGKISCLSGNARGAGSTGG